MDVIPNPAERPEDLLDAMAAGEDNLGARLLRLAREAAAFDRAGILDLLADDAPSGVEPDAQATAPVGRCGVQVGTARRTEVAR